MGRFLYKRRKFKVVVFLLIFSGLLSFTQYKLPVSNIKESISLCVLPLQVIGFYVKNLPHEIYNQVKELFILREENQRLKKYIAELSRKNKVLEKVLIENIRLKKLLKFKEAINNYNVITAKVIGYDPANINAVLIIDKGKTANIKEFSPVMVYQSEKEILVGRVWKVYPYSSFIMAITDKNSLIGVEIQRSNIKGILQGEELNLCKLKYITKEQEVNIGDELITSGDGKLFPKGLLVGKIIDIDYTYPTQFYDIKVKPYVDLQRLDEVFVIVNQ